MSDIERSFNKSLDEFLSKIAALNFLFEIPFIRKFWIIFAFEPLFVRMISEEIVCLFLLMNLLVLIVELLKFFS